MMTGTVYNGAYVNGITLSNPATQNPATIASTGYVTTPSSVTGLAAVFGTKAAAWTITNLGHISANGNAADVGIALAAAGSVTNGASGSAGGLITANAIGVDISGGPGTVTNFGTILGSGTGGGGVGVCLRDGGSVKNGASGSGGLIEGAFNGVHVESLAGIVANFGTILGFGTIGEGVDLTAGGSVVNGASGSKSGLIEGTVDGVYVESKPGTVTNFGSIVGLGPNAAGVAMTAGGSVKNGASGSSSGLITAARAGVEIGGGPGGLTNFGTILGSGTIGGGVDLRAGGSVANGARGSRSALIEGTLDGVAIAGALGAVTNFGSIVGLGANAAGVALMAGGTVVNGAGGGTRGLIEGQGDGVTIGGGLGTVTNRGTILGATFFGVYLADGGTVTNFGAIVSNAAGGGAGVHLKDGGTLINEQSARITTAGADAVEVAGRAGTVANLGVIVVSVGSGGTAVHLGDGGVLTNAASGLIDGRRAGVEIFTAAGTVTNLGAIAASGSGTSVPSAGVRLAAGGSLTNGAAGNRKAVISAVDGVAISIGGTAGGSGVITNYATVENTGSTTAGRVPTIYLGGGGTVTNYGLIAGKVSLAGGRGVITTLHAAATIDNFGTISSSSGNDGVHLEHGGTIINGSAKSTGALIEGGRIGIVAGFNPLTNVTYGAGAGLTLINYGTIEGSGTQGILAGSGGTVTNRGVITGVTNALDFTVASGAVVNLGTVRNAASGSAAIYLGAGGTVTNGSSASTKALIAGGTSGVQTARAAGTVSNFGSIAGLAPNAAGVAMAAGGAVHNGTSGGSGALITGNRVGVDIGGGTGTVNNFGTILGLGTIGKGVVLRFGGRIANGASGSTGGLIEGTLDGVAFTGKPGTVTNFGSIVGLGANAAGVLIAAGGAVFNGASGSGRGLIEGALDGVAITGSPGIVTNFGSIVGLGANAAGVAIGAGGSVVNGASGGTGGLIEGTLDGVAITGKLGTVTNFGTIKATGSGKLPGAGVEFAAGGNLTNRGLIESVAGTAVRFANKPGNVANFGSIVSLSGTTAGIDLGDGGVIANKRGALVEGTLSAGISVETAAATIVNAGTIESVSRNGISLASGGRLTNAAGGLIEGGVDGVYLTRPSGTVINSGTIEGGKIGFVTVGSGSETLINFGTIAGAGGVAIKIDGRAAGNVVIVEPGAVFVGSVLGGGKSEIEFAGGGGADMGGVNGFATIVLANGVKHALTLTAANFANVSGGVITVFNGNKGNTVGVTGSNPIIVHAGNGTDLLKGGTGNDIFYAGGRTTMTGGTGTNEFVFNAPGGNTITDFVASLTNELVFSNSGFGLGLPNATDTPAVLPASLLVVNSTGSFTNTAERFAYNTRNGDLFFSASGSNADEHLVVALTGAPPLTTTPNAHLFYIT